MEFKLVFADGNLQLPERIEFCAKDELTGVLRAQELARGHNATLWSGAGPRNNLGQRIIGFLEGAVPQDGYDAAADTVVPRLREAQVPPSIAPDTE